MTKYTRLLYCAISIVPDNSLQKKLGQYVVWWCHNFCLKYLLITVPLLMCPCLELYLIAEEADTVVCLEKSN